MDLDLLIVNARIRTGTTRSLANRLGVWAGRVVGLDEELIGCRTRRVLDAEGAFVMAGFNDAHAHSVWYGQTLVELDLSGVRTDRGLYEAIRGYASQDAGTAEEWIFASGYDPLGLVTAPPHRDVLDEASAGRPLLIKHTSGHAYTVNGVGLSRANIPEHPVEQPEGGVIVVDALGQATGLLEENAMRLVQDILLPEPLADLDRALERATTQYARQGLTSVTDAGIAGGWIGHSPREFAAYQRALERRALATRMQVMIVADALHQIEGHHSEPEVRGLDCGIRSGVGDDRLQIGPMKMFLDGSLLGGTAAMTEPYCSADGHRGYLQGDASELREHALGAARAGWALALHAIGDLGVDVALDTISEASAIGTPCMPHRIEHGGVVRPDQVRRIAELNVSLVPQPFFITTFGDGMAAQLGPDRVQMSYPAASVLRAGANLAGSSDRPVAPGAPLPIIQAFVERTTQSGAAYAPDERLTVEEALDAYTTGSARATGWQDDKGTLEAGKLADLVVLADDPREVATPRIGGIDVVATFRGGECTYGSLTEN